MKRLVRKSVMNMEMFKSTLNQLGDKGRNILKNIEDYKFSLEQAARITTNDQMLTQKIIQKRKSLDQAAAQIYSIVFDIENIDITQAYEQQMNPIQTPEQSGEGMPEIPQNNTAPNGNVPQNGAPINSTPENSVPSGGAPSGGIPSGGETAPTNEDDESKEDENSEDNSKDNSENEDTENTDDNEDTENTNE